MTAADLLVDAFGRIEEVVGNTLDGLSPDDVAFRPDDDSNSIAWLIWHLTRIQDDHVADVAGHEQVWTERGWSERFDLPFEVSATGYGHSADDVARVRVASVDLLLGYLEDVHERTVAYLRTLRDADFDRVVDERWDPPVTLGVRLISVISDDLQHAGQAAYVRGLLERT